MTHRFNKVMKYLFVAFLFYLFAKAGVYISSYYKLQIDLMLIISSLLFTIFIVILHTSWQNNTKDNFLFQVTPQKFCSDPYTYSSNPEKKKFCSQFTQSDINEYNCQKGFIGAPVHWQRDTLSNDDWENTTCDGSFNDYSYPQPL